MWPIGPEALEVRRHRDEPFADRGIDDDLIVVSSAFSFVSCVAQRAELQVPVCLERIGHKAITRIDQPVPALRQIGVNLGALDGATPQLIGLLVPPLDLSSDLQGQVDRRGCHLFDDQHAHRLVNESAGDRLATGLGPSAVRPIADVPRLQSAAPRRVSHAEVSAAPSTHRTSLQERRSLARGRLACDLVAMPVGGNDSEILL